MSSWMNGRTPLTFLAHPLPTNRRTHHVCKERQHQAKFCRLRWCLKNDGLSLMTGLGAGVRESLTGDWYELPIVTRRVQSQLNDAVARAVPDFAVTRGCGVKRHQSFPSRSNDEFANALGRIQIAIRILRGKTFVVVGMTVNHQISARVVQNLPERLYVWSCIGTCGGIKGAMKERHGAHGRVGSQISLKPLSLR